MRPHEPDEKSRATVEAMVSYGIPHEDIAKVIGIDDKTLRRHYRHEIDTASAKVNAQVAQRLYKKCMGDDTASIIFWLKTRARWSENQEHKVDVSQTVTYNISDQDRALLNRYLAIKGGSPDGGRIENYGNEIIDAQGAAGAVPCDRMHQPVD